MMPLLLQISSRNDLFRALRDAFNKDPSDRSTWIGLILVIGGFLILLLILHFILYYEARRDQPRYDRNQQHSFRELLGALPLNIAQRDLLQRLVRDLRLVYPLHLLLSPQMYEGFVQQWLGVSETRRAQYQIALTEIGESLFEEAPDARLNTIPA
ncbi:MAG: hypothetical protein HJJLKODD_02648 [Phycisphaerae bacterium]|nr:hypothetical protein [Phycisphaerae bacterium]